MGEKGSGRLENALLLLLRVHFIIVNLRIRDRYRNTVFEKKNDYGMRLIKSIFTVIPYSKRDNHVISVFEKDMIMVRFYKKSILPYLERIHDCLNELLRGIHRYDHFERIAGILFYTIASDINARALFHKILHR